MSKADNTAAEQCLQELIVDIESSNPKTLAYWRLQNADIRLALQEFCRHKDKDENNSNNDETKESVLLSKVLELFGKLNRHMMQQEKEQAALWGNVSSRNNNNNNDDHHYDDNSDSVIVFGGKYSATPNSISETLVDLLSTTTTASGGAIQIVTVSRSNVTNLPSTITHVTKQNLDDLAKGEQEFTDILTQYMISNNQQQQQKTSIFFTLGQHKGQNPFQRNIQAANNFAKALECTISNTGMTNFKIVITGTDATLPSTYEDPTIQWNEVASNDSPQSVVLVPSYKIMTYNFVYAMSKICQYYMIGNAVANVLKLLEFQQQQEPSMTSIISKLQSSIIKAGENGNWNESLGITIPELNELSTRWTNTIEPQLSSHLLVAKGISICYTPLHAIPWTNQAFVKCQEESKGSPRGYLIQQIVRRMKNAISIGLAARKHFSIK